MIATGTIPSLADHHLLASNTSLAPSQEETPLPAEAPPAAQIYDLTIYEPVKAALAERVEQFLNRIDCRVLHQDISTVHLFRGAEQYKAVLTFDASRCDQAELQLWYDAYKKAGDADLERCHDFRRAG